MADREQIDKKEVKQRWIAVDLLEVIRADGTIPAQIKSDEGRIDYKLRQQYKANK